MRMNLSIKNKIFAAYLVVLLLGVGSVGWIGYNSAYEAYLGASNQASAKNTATIKLSIETQLESVPKDIKFLSENYALKRYMIWKPMSVAKQSQKWKTIFSDILKDFLETRANYYSVRVLDLDGNELIAASYDYQRDLVSIKPQNKLQNKKGRDYVEITKHLKKGEFFISKMNLNIENGKIEKPYIPVVRYATPMYNGNNMVVGILVANIYAKQVLDIIHNEKMVDNDLSYYLVDRDGTYLYNIDKEKLWGGQLKHGYNFKKEYPEAAKEMIDDSGTFIHEGKLFSYHKVYPLESVTDNYWYIISYVDKDIALAKLDSFNKKFISIVIFVIVFSFFLIRFYLGKLILPLSKVTQQLKALSKGEIVQVEIDYDSEDEIGDIVHSTSKLVNAIETTIHQANAVANGNFTKDIELLSKNDKLGLAITNMTKRLKEISVLAQKLSVGNYDTKIVANSSEDVLGLALIDMIAYLETVTEVAESIAKGEIDIDYKAVGADDRLGIAMLKMISYLKTILYQANAITNDDFSNKIIAKSSKDQLSIAMARMTEILKANSEKNKDDVYFNEGINSFSDQLSGVNDIHELSKESISISSRYVNASSGVVYTYDKDSELLTLVASYAFNTREELSNSFKIGEGVVGQVALEKEPIMLSNIHDSSTKIVSGTTISQAKTIYTLPLIHEGELLGVVEYMSFEEFTPLQQNYLNKVCSIFSISLYATSQNLQIKLLLEKSQSAYEELQSQSEELQESNVQMEEQQQQLALQAKEMNIKNQELMQAKADLDKRANDLEKASKYKSEFLANMSHELRTPLNSIILLSKLLNQNKDGHLDDSDLSKAAVINKAGNDLLLLINDILDLSKIESGNMELMIEEVATKTISSEIHGLFSEVANEKHLLFKIEDKFDGLFKTDKTKLLQVLKNLLSNAFKFTKEGEIVLRIDSGEDTIIFEVKDSGIGIPAEKSKLIFEAFKQVDGSISREYGGTGLGLSISKTFIDLMGGTIELESEEGRGSTFRVILPLNSEVELPQKEPEEITHEVESVVEDKTSVEKHLDAPIITESDEIFGNDILSGKNILIVDDDSRNIFTLSSVIQELGAETYSALNGDEAIKFLESEEESIDVILMDIMMPIMDGLESMKWIKSNEKFKHIPIIAITAKSMRQDKEECFAAGANDYLAKPIDHNALVSMLQAWSE